MKKLLALSLALLLCLTACGPLSMLGEKDDTQPETETQIETEEETLPKLLPEEKFHSPFDFHATQSELWEALSVYENGSIHYHADIDIACPEPSDEVKASWAQMSEDEKAAAQKAFYAENLVPVAEDIGIPGKFCSETSPTAHFTFTTNGQYSKYVEFLKLWAEDDRILSITVTLETVTLPETTLETEAETLVSEP